MPLRAGLPPLVPGIKTTVSRRNDPNRADADDAFVRVRKGVLRRDNYTCQYCGFTCPPKLLPGTGGSGYLEVHHIDDDHGNNDEMNLVTICPMCHLVFHVGFHGFQGSATVIWCPWISQEDLSLLCNCAAVAVYRKGTEIAPAAQALLSALESLNTPAANIENLSVLAHDPAALGTALGVLAKTDKGLFNQRHLALSELRVLPSIAHFQKAIAFWSDHRWLPGTTWEEGWKRVHTTWLGRVER